MPSPPRLLIAFYSRTGSTETLATAAADAAREAGADVRLRRAREVASDGITVNTIPPSFVDTPSLRAAEESGFLGPGVETLLQSMPVKRVGTPEDIAAACAYLVRDDAGFVTGQVLGVNGGRVMG